MPKLASMDWHHTNNVIEINNSRNDFNNTLTLSHHIG